MQNYKNTFACMHACKKKKSNLIKCIKIKRKSFGLITLLSSYTVIIQKLETKSKIEAKQHVCFTF